MQGSALQALIFDDWAVLLINRLGYGSHCIGATWFGVAGFGVGSIAGMIMVTVLGSPGSCDS